MRGRVWLVLCVAGCGGPSRDGVFTASDAGSVVDARTATDAGGERCRAQADCDDGFACTDDACVVGGVCEHVAVTSRCAMGERCDLARGCVSAMTCAADTDCDDGVPCTRDLCAVGGVCQSVRDDARCASGQTCTSTGCAAQGRCARDEDCANGVYCDGDERCVSGACARGTTRSCDDGDPCTGDVCNEGTRSCDHPPVSPCGGSFSAGTYALTPTIAYSCGAGSIGPVATVTLSLASGGVRVEGFPAALTGSPPSGGMFSATGSESRGGCTWRYALAGSFTADGRFSGSWNIAFDACSAVLGCRAQSGEVSGSRR